MPSFMYLFGDNKALTGNISNKINKVELMKVYVCVVKQNNYLIK